jgi:hypothetical protein
MSPADPSTLSAAILVWTGWDTSSAWPARDDARLVGRVGAELAGSLLPRIKELEAEFYSSNARYVAKNIKEMGDLAASSFQKEHPEISAAAVEAFAWCYTYDFK